MKILAENSLVKTIGKGIPCKDANAVSLGILSFKKTAASILREALEEIVQIEQSLTSHFPAVIQYMIDAGHPVFTHCVPAFNCADIDTIDDLKFITKQWHRFYSSNQCSLREFDGSSHSIVSQQIRFRKAITIPSGRFKPYRPSDPHARKSWNKKHVCVIAPERKKSNLTFPLGLRI